LVEAAPQTEREQYAGSSPVMTTKTKIMELFLVFAMPIEYYDWEIPRYKGVFKTLQEANEYADKLVESYKPKWKSSLCKNVGLIESYFVLGGKPKDVQYPSCDDNGDAIYEYITLIIKQTP